MEAKIKSVINSFINDFDQRKLYILDNFLLSLLFRKEIYLLQLKKDKEVKRIEDILSRYFNYRDLIYRKLLENRVKDEEFLIRNIYSAHERLVLLLTHDCQLRCKYCRVRKFPVSMNEEVLLKAIDLLFTSNSLKLQLQFFGGEPLLRFDLIKKTVMYVSKINKRFKKDIIFFLTTNGIDLTKERVDFLKNHRFIVEYSIDGEIENQLKTRRACNSKDYYSRMINNFEYLRQSGIPCYSISVFMPENTFLMFKSFQHLVKLGFRRLQMNYSLGVFWPREAIETLFQQTDKIITYIRKRGDVEFVNLTSMRREPVVLNAELTVDYDGKIYLESGICLEDDFLAMKKKFLVTDVGEAKNINFYNSTQFQNLYRLSKIYASSNPEFRKVIVNNILLGLRYSRLLHQ